MAAMGSVKTQENMILEITFEFPLPVTNPIPKIDPQEACVVDTGKPHRLARITKNPVITFAVKPWP